MSDLATAARLRQAASQFPASWYCDPRVLDAERKHLLARAPGYVGHELMVPERGDYRVLASRDNAQALVHGPQGIELLSNVCRHRQAIMLTGSGNAPNIVCPIHRWTYDLQGKLLGAPHFENQPCAHLGRSAAAELERTALRRSPRRRARSVEPHAARSRLLGLRPGPGRSARMQLQLEDVHRGVPRGLPRAAVPSRPRSIRHLRRASLGIRRMGVGPVRRREQRPGQAGHAQRTSAGTRRCSTITAAGSQRTARSGSPTIRTSWSSGIRTCSS